MSKARISRVASGTSAITAFVVCSGFMFGSAAMAQHGDQGFQGDPQFDTELERRKAEAEKLGSEIPLEEKDLDTPEKMLAEIDRLTDLINEYLMSIPGQQMRNLGPSETEHNDPLPQRDRLIWMLYEADPMNERLEPLMNERWGIMNRTKQRSFVIGEAKKVMENPSISEELYTTSLYWNVFAAMRATMQSPLNTPERLLQQADRFVGQYPEDPRGAALLGYLARGLQRFPEDQMALFRRLGKEYPDTFMGKISAGKVRQVDEIGKPFELEFEDLQTGETVSIDSHRGSVVVIDFLSTFCRPCMKDLPGYMNLRNQYADQGVVFLAVSLDRLEERGGRKALEGMLAETKLDWPVYYQGSGFQSEFSMSWGIDSMPAIFVIGPEGHLRSTDPGNDLEKIIEALLKGDTLGSDAKDEARATGGG